MTIIYVNSLIILRLMLVRFLSMPPKKPKAVVEGAPVEEEECKQHCECT